MIKIIIVLLLLYILFNLFRALFVMMSAKEHSKPMSHYLGRRVLFSGIVLVLIIAAMNWALFTPTRRRFTKLQHVHKHK
ncbi:DUF2909 domain-containing protein [Pseudoalteromonas sp. NCCP-2140]|uniref:DUF2909 domain-containing protein n=1 Tax=Pseudoalteromonas sp. NCCP-2140 TaxID=2942288 RepID=UPI00203DD627|nr:DUF2909 domain-containing protein [Pseudoalteromonas sp. NCCP-2140]